MARPLSVGIIIRLVSLRSSLRALNSAGERLVLGDLAVLRIPTTWVWALSVISSEALALLRAVSMQVTISAVGFAWVKWQN